MARSGRIPKSAMVKTSVSRVHRGWWCGVYRTEQGYFEGVVTGPAGHQAKVPGGPRSSFDADSMLKAAGDVMRKLARQSAELRGSFGG